MSVTLHCDTGDIKIELHVDKCPKTCENFLALAASDYYNENLFHVVAFLIVSHAFCWLLYITNYLLSYCLLICVPGRGLPWITKP